MAKPINQFGGWLRFFQVMNILAVLVLPFLTLFVLFVAVGTIATGDVFGFLFFGIGIVEMIAACVISVLILIQLPKRDSSVPTKIQKLLTIEVIIAVVCSLIVVPLSDFSTVIGSEAVFDTLKGMFQSIGYFVVWNKYFGASQRVQAFYTEESGVARSKKVFVDIPGASNEYEDRREIPEMVRSFES